MNIEQIFGEELRKIRKESGGGNSQLSSGRYEFGTGVYCDLRKTADGGLTIDRLFVSEKLRGSGLHKKMLSALVWLSDEIGVELFMAVAPDRLEGEAIDSSRYNKVTDLLVSSAEQLGFQPYRDGEDVYRLDLTYTPKKSPLKSRPIVCVEGSVKTQQSIGMKNEKRSEKEK